MKWFRLYHDLPNDRKLRKFNPQQKWAWVVLLCLASESKERGTVFDRDQEDTADYCGFECTQDYLYFLDKLRQKEMIEPVQGGYKITHWEDRQYIKPSDSPEKTRERKRKQRAIQKELSQEVSRVTSRDECVTSRHTDTDPYSDPDSDTKKEINTYVDSPEKEISSACTDRPEVDKSSGKYEPFLKAWNDGKPSHFAKVLSSNKVNKGRKKKIDQLVAEYKDRDKALEVFKQALRWTHNPKFWGKDLSLNFDNLWTNGKITGLAELQAALEPDGTSENKKELLALAESLERQGFVTEIPYRQPNSDGPVIRVATGQFGEDTFLEITLAELKERFEQYQTKTGALAQ